MKPMTLSELISARIAAKRAEDDAIATRRELDTALANMLRDPTKAEGSVSQKADGYKITVTYKVTRAVDTDALSADWAKLSADVQAAFKWKADVAISSLRKLEGDAQYAASRYITAKEASPSITIEAV